MMNFLRFRRPYRVKCIAENMKQSKLGVGAAIFVFAATVQTESAAVGVAVSAINYTGEEMSYVAEDPSNPANAAAEVVGPFAAGGVMCCYDLPKKWKPGITVKVKFYDVKEKLIRDISTDVLPYVDGKVEHLWIASYPDGTVEAISSQYIPTHEKWSGRVKGWPVPSIEFRRQLWDQKMSDVRSNLQVEESLLTDVIRNPRGTALESWEYGMKNNDKYILRFAGPDDPEYINYLRERYERGAKAAREELSYVERHKP